MLRFTLHRPGLIHPVSTRCNGPSDRRWCDFVTAVPAPPTGLVIARPVVRDQFTETGGPSWRNVNAQ